MYKLKRIYDHAEIRRNKFYLEDKAYDMVLGKHEIWIPGLELKIIWSMWGQILAHKTWQKSRHKKAIAKGTFGQESQGFNKEALESILHEYRLLDELAKVKMAPPVKGLVYFRFFSSDFIKPGFTDVCGVYGFFIRDANKLEPGRWNLERFLKKFVKNNRVEVNPWILGDFNKPKNIINGYMIDARRTKGARWLDMKDVDTSGIEYKEDVNQLKKDIENLTQFPFNKRKKNYQSYYLEGEGYNNGSRNTEYRFEQMGIGDLKGKSVLDLGCNLGSMCIEAYRRGARNIVGLDYQKEYIEVGKRLVKYNGMNINLRQADLTKVKKTLKFIKGYFNGSIDVVFALALYKHIGQNLWDVLDGFKWKTCYLESHSAKGDVKTPQVKEIEQFIKNKKGWKVTDLGLVKDRSQRYIWRIDR